MDGILKALQRLRLHQQTLVQQQLRVPSDDEHR